MRPRCSSATLMSGLPCDTRDVDRGELARDVDVAVLQQQPLGGAARERGARRRGPAAARRASRRHRLEDVAVGRLVGAEHVGARTRRVGLQPLVAEVAVRLVGQRLLLVDDRGHDRGQAVEEEGRRIGLVGDDDEGAVVGRLDLLGDVLRGEAELRQDEGRGLVRGSPPAAATRPRPRRSPGCRSGICAPGRILKV